MLLYKLISFCKVTQSETDVFFNITALLLVLALKYSLNDICANVRAAPMNHCGIKVKGSWLVDATLAY